MADAPTVQPGAGALAGAEADPGNVPNPDAFISYSHLDREFAVRLREALRARGKSAWLDETEIHGGTRWSDALERAIQTADAFLFVLSPHSAASRECGAELEHALTLNKRILPLRAADTPIESLPPGLSDYQFIPGRRLFTDDFGAALDQLITEIETDRDWVREHTDWSEKAGEWEQHGRNRAYLLGGSELEAAEGWRSRAAGKRPGLSTLQSEFIDASRQWATRRLRRTRSAVSVALVVALGLTILAFILRQQAVSEGQVATSGELSAESLLQVGSDPQLGLLLAVRAAGVRETPEALDALRSTIPQNHLLRDLTAGDSSPLDSAQWSAGGTMVVTASEDGYARVYNATTGAVIRRFPISTGQGGGAMFTDGDREVIGWVVHGSVHIWNLATGAALAAPSDPSFLQLTDVVVNSQGTMIATAGGPGEGAAVLLFDARTGRLLHVLERAGPNLPTSAVPQTVAFSPNGDLLAGGSQQGIATVWDTRTGQVARRLALETPSESGPEPDVNTASFSPDGKELATSQQDANGKGRTVVWTVSNWSHSAVNGVEPTWSPDSRYLATTVLKGYVLVWNAATAKLYASLNAGAPTTIPSIFGSGSNGQAGDLVTASQSGQAKVWDPYTGTLIGTLAGDAGLVTPVGYSPDGSRILTSSSDGSARIWDSGAITGKPATAPQAVKALESPGISQFLGPSYDEAADLLSPLRAYAVKGALHVIDVGTGTSLATIPGHGAGFDSAAFDSAGRVLLVTRSGSTPGSGGAAPVYPAEVFRAHGGALLHVLGGPGSLARGGVVSPDGKLVAAVDSAGDIGVWDVASGHEVTVSRREQGSAKDFQTALVDLKFSPDGTLVLSGGLDGRAFVWRARTGQVLSNISGNAEPSSGQFRGVSGAISSDDRLVVITRGWNNYAVVYRVGDHRPLTTLQGQSLPIADAAFNLDGTLIGDASADGTVDVFDTQHSGPLLTEPVPGAAGVSATQVAFSADGRSLVTDLAVPYETLPCVICGGFPELLAAARQRETRGFTAEERSKFHLN